jgi:hypothetical protein
MIAKNSVPAMIRKSFLKTRRRIQIIASLTTSILINRFGTYPNILDFVISKNHFKILKYKKYPDFEIEHKVIEILGKVELYRKEQVTAKQEKKRLELIVEKPKIAFLMSGPMNSLTNNILANIADSYDGNVTLTLNQSFGPNGSQIQITTDTCFELIENFIPKIIFFELHTKINEDSDESILSKDFIRNIKKQVGCEIYVICFDIWRDFDVEYMKYWSDLADRFIHIDEYSASKLHKEFPMFNWLYPALSKLEFGDGTKETDLFYQGSIREYDRRKILVYAGKICRQFGINYDFNTFVHHTYTSIPTREEYLHALSRSRYCLSVSQKATDHWLVTFRSIEAIIAGVVPIQQVGKNLDPLSVYYIPYRHYLPFDSPLALAANIHIIKNHKEVVDFLSEQLRVFHGANYGQIELWHQLLRNQQTKKLVFPEKTL